MNSFTRSKPLRKAGVAADLTASYLLEPERAARMVEQKALDASLPGFDDVLDRLPDFAQVLAGLK